jgi:hypothetical protein
MEQQQSYRVLADYDVNDPHPLRLRAGTTVDIIRNDSTWPGWQWIRADDQQGWIPDSFLTQPSAGTPRELIRDFDGTELSASRGTELIAMASEPGWILASDPSGKRGWFPLFNLRPLPDI